MSVESAQPSRPNPPWREEARDWPVRVINWSNRMTVGKKWVVLGSTVILAATAFAVWPYLPKRYQSGTTLAIVSQRVPERYVKSSVTTAAEERLQALAAKVQSRTSLERTIQEFNLYPRQRRAGIMEDVVELMRRDITIENVKGNAFRVSYQYTDPRLAMRVADRLSGRIVDESTADRAVMAQSTSAFLADQAGDVRRRLNGLWKELERARGERNTLELQALTLEEEVLRATYKSLLTNLEDAKLATNLENRAIGEQFRLIDPAHVPEAPLGPTRSRLTFVGAVVGLCLGLAIAAVLAVRRAQRARCATP